MGEKGSTRARSDISTKYTARWEKGEGERDRRILKIHICLSDKSSQKSYKKRIKM
jgi:hypothetical protein